MLTKSEYYLRLKSYGKLLEDLLQSLISNSHHKFGPPQISSLPVSQSDAKEKPIKLNFASMRVHIFPLSAGCNVLDCIFNLSIALLAFCCDNDWPIPQNWTFFFFACFQIKTNFAFIYPLPREQKYDAPKLKQQFKQLFFVFADINECAIQGICRNGRCINSQGGFQCDCRQGYALDGQRHDCVGRKEERAVLRVI